MSDPKLRRYQHQTGRLLTAGLRPLTADEYNEIDQIDGQVAAWLTYRIRKGTVDTHPTGPTPPAATPAVGSPEYAEMF